jgi:uncharacterized protein
MNVAFATGQALPLRAQHASLTSARRSAHPTVARMSLAEDVKRGGTALAVAAAIVLGSDALPLTAQAAFPDTAPDTLFFDEAGVVGKSSASLAAKGLASVQTRTGFNVFFVLPKSVPYGESPADYAKELFQTWNGGEKDVIVVGGTKVARAGVYAGAEAAKFVTADIAESIGTETYAQRAGEEAYGSAVLAVNNRIIPVLSGEADPGPPAIANTERVATFKTKAETNAQRGKYIKIVGGGKPICIKLLWEILFVVSDACPCQYSKANFGRDIFFVLLLSFVTCPLVYGTSSCPVYRAVRSHHTDTLVHCQIGWPSRP